MKRLGLIGCGTIGSHLALAVDTGKIANASLVSIFDVVAENAHSLESRLARKPKTFKDIDGFLHSDIDIVVEAASQEAVRSFARPCLSAGKDLMIMSVGALADSAYLADLLAISRKSGNRIYIPTGAIAGIDAIRSAKDLIDSITLTTTKSPNALAGAPFFAISGLKPETITQRATIYSGPASEAVRLFPANVNVAAVLSLAGIGPEKTQVRIVADPNAKTNKHEIMATGSFGEIHISVNNVQSPGNPKTSYLAILSAIGCLRSICDDSIHVGS
jgi:aspartate dehydrogenase